MENSLGSKMYMECKVGCTILDPKSGENVLMEDCFFEWETSISGVPQESALEPNFFYTHITKL